jgi:hypothetical protein
VPPEQSSGTKGTHRRSSPAIGIEPRDPLRGSPTTRTINEQPDRQTAWDDSRMAPADPTTGHRRGTTDAETRPARSREPLAPQGQSSHLIPTLDGAIDAVNERIDALGDVGALDAATPVVVDRLVDTWMSHWREWAEEQRRWRIEQAWTEYDEAEASRSRAEQSLRAIYGRLIAYRAALEPIAAMPPPRLQELMTGQYDVPPPNGPSEQTWVKNSNLPPRRGWRARLEGAVNWLVLAVMSGGEAFGIWSVLAGRVGGDHGLLIAFFSVAVAIATVAVALIAGQLLRRHREGADRHTLPWIFTFGGVWAAQGLSLFWLRAHPVAVGNDPSGLQSTTEPAAWGIAALGLLLYMMTGAIAATVGFASTDKASALWTAFEDAEKDVADAAYRFHVADAHVRAAERTVRRLEAQGSADEEIQLAGDAVKHEARLRLARHPVSVAGSQAPTKTGKDVPTLPRANRLASPKQEVRTEDAPTERLNEANRLASKQHSLDGLMDLFSLPKRRTSRESVRRVMEIQKGIFDAFGPPPGWEPTDARESADSGVVN